TAATTPDRAALDLSADATELDTAALDRVLDQQGMVSGALGPTADLSVSVREDLIAKQPPSDAPKPVRARVQVKNSPRLRTDPLDVIADDQHIALGAPAKINWTLDPAWVDRFVLSGADGKPQTHRLKGQTTLEIDVHTLSISRPESRGGLVITGPLKPG